MFLAKAIVWTSAVSLTILLGIQSYLSFVEYLSDTTFQALELKDQKDANTPRVSFCFPEKDGQELWELIKYFHVRFFDFNYELNNQNIRLNNNSKIDDIQSMIEVRMHPKKGKCVTLNNDKYKSSGLYYIKAEFYETSDVFVHQAKTFWHSISRFTGIKSSAKETTQNQIFWVDVFSISDQDCLTESQDTCFENHLTKQLKDQTGCRPKNFEVENLQICTEMYQDTKSSEIVKTALAGIEKICPQPCNFLNIHTGARNFEPTKTTRWYGYFIPKVPVRYS